MIAVLSALDAFYLEHRRCGELESDVDGDRVDDVHVRGGAESAPGARAP